MGGIRRHGFQQSLNTTIGNAKRFMASEFIKRLEEKEAAPLLDLLHGAKAAHPTSNWLDCFNYSCF
jgi:hypothetical protein